MASSTSSPEHKNRSEQLYERSSRVILDLHGDRVHVHALGRRVTLDDLALRLLGAFATPQRIPVALAGLWTTSDGPTRWIRLTSTLAHLIRIRALIPVASSTPARLAGGFSHPSVHVRMLNDARRVTAFIQALEQTVTQSDVVLDIGTGTGILALAAARAGARRVISIEQTSIADAAAGVIAASPWRDRITLVRGHSAEVTLEEPATVLVTETIGTEGFDEQIHQTIADARRRHLHSDARVIPATLHLQARAVSVPDDALEAARFTETGTMRWTEAYGFDFSPLSGANPESQRLWLPFHQARRLTPMTNTVTLTGGSAESAAAAAFDTRVTLEAGRSGAIDGVAVFFSSQLVPGIELNNDPWRADAADSWGCQTLLFRQPRHVRCGEHVHLRLSRLHGRLALEESTD